MLNRKLGQQVGFLVLGSVLSIYSYADGSLAAYKQLLKQAPLSSFGVTATSNQYTIIFTTSTLIDSIVVSFYLFSNCTSVLGAPVNLTGPTNFNQGTYVSTNASNFDLCSLFSSGGTGCLAELQKVNSIKFTYNIDGGSTVVNCLNNGDNGDSILNYVTQNTECTDGQPCGFIDTYQDTIH